MKLTISDFHNLIPRLVCFSMTKILSRIRILNFFPPSPPLLLSRSIIYIYSFCTFLSHIFLTSYHNFYYMRRMFIFFYNPFIILRKARSKCATVALISTRSNVAALTRKNCSFLFEQLDSLTLVSVVSIMKKPGFFDYLSVNTDGRVDPAIFQPL